MLQVILKQEEKLLELQFKYNKDYIARIKQIPSATFHAETKNWTVALEHHLLLEDIFENELMYITPKYEITGEDPPDYSLIYKQVTKVTPFIKPPYKLYPFQLFGANFLATMAKKYGFACLLDDMGTGKTLQAIAGALILNQTYGLGHYQLPVLVVCKSSLKYQWVTDGIDKFTEATSVVIDGTKKKRLKQYESLTTSKCFCAIVGYETLREDIEVIKTLNIGLIILDEAHKIKNKETKINKACQKLKSKYKFFLTGTPLSKQPADLFGLGIVGSKDYFGTWEAFKKEYMTINIGPYGEEYFYRNLSQLRDKMDQIALRRTEKEIGIEMPDIVQQYIRVPMSKIQMQIEEDLIYRLTQLQNALLELTSQTALSATDTSKKEAIEAKIKGIFALRVGCADTSELFTLSRSDEIRRTYGEIAKKDSISPKLAQLVEHVQEIVDSGHKVVIFTKFETMTRLIEKYLTKVGPVVLFTGKMNAYEKEEARVQFKTSCKHNIFVATNAGSDGLNLQVAKYLINFDLDWDTGVNDQRNKRIRRLDSTFKTVFVYNYISENSADELIVRALEQKQCLVDYFVSNTKAQSDQLKHYVEHY